MKKHYVRIVRPRFELMVVEVSAADHKEAEMLALEQADDADDDAWTLLDHDPGTYDAHVQRCTSEDDVEANSSGPSERAEIVQTLLDPTPDEDFKYLLLLADVADGEGRVIWERWLKFHEPDLLESDLIDDWISALIVLRGRSPNFPNVTEEMLEQIDRNLSEGRNRGGRR